MAKSKHVWSGSFGRRTLSDVALVIVLAFVIPIGLGFFFGDQYARGQLMHNILWLITAVILTVYLLVAQAINSYNAI